MGRDKALLPFHGVPMIRQMADLVALVTGRPAVLLGPRARYGALGWPVVQDSVEGAGPLAGLVAMLESAEAADLNLVVPVDMPGLTPALGRKWLEAARADAEWDAVVAAGSPLSGVYRRRALPVLREALDAGRRKVWDAVKSLRLLEIPAAPELLVNLNTPEDWAGFGGVPHIDKDA